MGHYSDVYFGYTAGVADKIEKLFSKTIGQLPEELFDNCRVYRYFNVPKSVYEAFINFPSKGEYLCEHIAYKFEYEFLGDGEAYKP